MWRGKAMVAKMIRPVRARAVLLVVGEEGMSTVEYSIIEFYNRPHATATTPTATPWLGGL
jgi:hypothetical protein